jgi:hypothetical protein
MQTKTIQTQTENARLYARRLTTLTPSSNTTQNKHERDTIAFISTVVGTNQQLALIHRSSSLQTNSKSRDTRVQSEGGISGRDEGKKIKRGKVLTPGEDLPALVVALGPLPEHDLGAVMDAAVGLVAVEGVQVEVDVVDHAHAAEAFAHVAALRPQHGLIKQAVGVVRHKLHLSFQYPISPRGLVRFHSIQRILNQQRRRSVSKKKQQQRRRSRLTGWPCPVECLRASPVTVFTSTEAGYPSSSRTLVLCLMSLTQCCTHHQHRRSLLTARSPTNNEPAKLKDREWSSVVRTW